MVQFRKNELSINPPGPPSWGWERDSRQFFWVQPQDGRELGSQLSRPEVEQNIEAP